MVLTHNRLFDFVEYIDEKLFDIYEDDDFGSVTIYCSNFIAKMLMYRFITELYEPVSINFEDTDVSFYEKEYAVTVNSESELFIEKAYDVASDTLREDFSDEKYVILPGCDEKIADKLDCTKVVITELIEDEEDDCDGDCDNCMHNTEKDCADEDEDFHTISKTWYKGDEHSTLTFSSNVMDAVEKMAKIFKDM